MLHRIRLELAQSREFPNGNPACGYELQLPLAPDRHLDFGACQRNRNRNRHAICRFGPQEEWRGELKCDHRGWFFAFGQGEATDAALLRRTRFNVDDWIPITEFDGQTRHFRVVEVAKVPHAGDPAKSKTSHRSNSLVEGASGPLKPQLGESP